MESYNQIPFFERIFVKSFCMFVPPVGYLLRIDGSPYLVIDSINEDGVYSITAEANRS